MQSLLNPRWLYLLNSLPIVLFFTLSYWQFTGIKNLLTDESIRLWKYFSIVFATIGIINFMYAKHLVTNKLKVSAFYGAIALITYLGFIYFYSIYVHELMPYAVSKNVWFGNSSKYVGTFLMPTLIYALLVLVVKSTKRVTQKDAVFNFLMAIIVPVLLYFVAQIILPLWKIVGDDFEEHTISVLIISGLVTSSFFAVKAIFLFFTKRKEWLNENPLTWKISICILFPFLGLILNNEILSNAFGDFGSFSFYALAILNGVLLCLPDYENKGYRLFLFLARCACLVYTVYFFLVFLPYIPLSIVAVLIFGAGLLMIVPILLMVIHCKELVKDFNYLSKYTRLPLLILLAIISFSVIPSIITIEYFKCKKTLNHIVSYFHNTNDGNNIGINKSTLGKTLNSIKLHKQVRGGFMFRTAPPILSSYFNWIVLGNSTISNGTTTKIEKIFFDKNPITHDIPGFQRRNRKDDVQITDVSTKSTYDEEQDAWRSWIDLEITNYETRRFCEYETVFELPEGAWISDYYLYVGDRKEKGILSEKKSAMSIYSSITRVKRDPGILYYLTGNKVAFKVFPFSADEVRRTGIEILHKSPIEITMDKHQLKLGEEGIQENIFFENDQFAYIPALQKKQLKKVYRQPYFHFIVDCSKNVNDYYSVDIITQLANEYPELTKNAEISFVNSYVNTNPFDNSWEQQLKSQKLEGGFYIDRAIKNLLRNTNFKSATSYPVIVVVSDDIETAIFDKDFADWQFAFPEGDSFYNLNIDGSLDEHSLTSKPKEVVKENVLIPLNRPVLEYQFGDRKFTYLADNDKPGLVVKDNSSPNEIKKYAAKNWQSAATMQANWRNQLLHPNYSTKAWYSLVRQSFQTQVMTPVTSFLALENDAQKARLKRKQEQVLASNSILNLNGTPQQMSEPGLLLLGILLLLFLWFKGRKVSPIIEQT